jgi:hypothetical protein
MNSNTDQQLGAYSAGMLPSLLSMSNWAANLATGGNLSSSLANPYNTVGGGNSQIGSQVLGYNSQLGTSLSLQPQQFGSNPFGLGGSGGTGAVGTGAAAGTAGTTGQAGAVGTPGAMATSSSLPGASESDAALQAWYGQNQGKTVYNSQGQPVTIPTGPTPEAGTIRGWIVNPGGILNNASLSGPGTMGSAAPTTSSSGVVSSGAGSELGPFLQNAWDAIQAEGAGATQLSGEGTNIYNEGQGLLTSAEGMINQGQGMLGAAGSYLNEGQSILGQGQGMVNQATTGTGLYPSQQAMVNQAVQSQQAAIQQQMASEGLTSSTQNAQLKGQAAQQGAATAGQLIQGNIAAGQAQENVGISQENVGISQEGVAQQQEQLGLGLGQLAQGFTQLGAATQQAAIGALATMASQSSQMQTNLWTEAMGGYGMVGQFLQTALAGFGASTQALQQYTQASETQQQLQFQAQASAAQASNSGMSSMLGGLGQLLGGGSGGGGGLIGSLGGLLGGAGGAAAAGIGGAASAAGGAGAAAGISAAATAVGAAFGVGSEPRIPHKLRAKWMSARG